MMPTMPDDDDLIDLDALADMRRAIGRDAIIEVGLELAQSLRDSLRDLDARHRYELGALAHALKGSTSYLGTRSLHERAVAADRAYKEGGDPRPPLEELAALVEPTLRRLEEEVMAMPEDEI